MESERPPPSGLFFLAVPRGLDQAKPNKALAESGTANVPMETLGFLAAISHRRGSFGAPEERIFIPEKNRSAPNDVRFTPESGRVRRKPLCLLWANSGHLTYDGRRREPW
jgi:hypothetical protein